jgi:molybdopterin-binding protein
LTLATADAGTLKIITHGTLTANVQINVPQGNGFSSIVISTGKSAILFFSNGKWNNLSF